MVYGIIGSRRSYVCVLIYYYGKTSISERLQMTLTPNRIRNAYFQVSETFLGIGN